MSKFFVFYLTIAFSCAYMAKSQLNFPILKDSYIESNINLIVMLNSILTFPQLVESTTQLICGNSYVRHLNRTVPTI